MIKAMLASLRFISLFLYVSNILVPGLAQTTWRNPVLRGDHPDPSVIRVGQEFWSTNTSGEWSPQFPLFRSRDLAHWKPVGAVFETEPKWAEGSFWAPELVSDKGRYFVFYAARKRGGPLCVAVASASAPGGPYLDGGPLVCQEAGSIDPAFSRDEAGFPYLIWKEDGNSIHRPTQIWAQRLTDDLQHLIGEQKELIVNDEQSWEGGVVEAPYMLRHQGRFYLFYAGNACCGAACHYAEGVARADHLLGPWEKDAANPIIVPNGDWKCPGHGSIVQGNDGRDYLLYHAYPVKRSTEGGREGILDRIDWGADGWPRVNEGNGPKGMDRPSNAQPSARYEDSFLSSKLDTGWQWPIRQKPKLQIGAGELKLTIAAEGVDAQSLLARSSSGSEQFAAEVIVGPTGSGWGGIALIAGGKDEIGLSRQGSKLEEWEKVMSVRRVLWTGVTEEKAAIKVRLTVTQSGSVGFSTKLAGKAWQIAGAPVSVTRLPARDGGPKAALVVDGNAGNFAVFRNFLFVSGGSLPKFRNPH